MKKFLFFTLLFCSSLAIAQKKATISIPENKEDIKDKAMFSTDLIKAISTGSVKIYTDETCTQTMQVAEFRKRTTDSTLVSVLDNKGNVTGNHMVAKEYQPGPQVRFVAAKVAKGRPNSFAFTRPLLSSEGMYIADASVCYLKTIDLEKLVAAFEKGHYDTHFKKQIEQFGK